MSSSTDKFADLERDALRCATYTSMVQTLLNAASGFFAATGLGLLLVSLASLANPAVVKAFAPQAVVSLTILLWVPLSVFLPRLFGEPPAINGKEFRLFFKQSTGGWAVASRSAAELSESVAVLKKITDDSAKRSRIVASFGLRQLNLAAPLAAVGLALAGLCIYSSAVAGAGLTATLQLLVMPLTAIAALGLVVAFSAWSRDS